MTSNTENPTPDYDTPALRAHAAVNRAIAELVARTHGKDGFTLWTPVGFDWTPQRQPTPLAALGAALLVRSAAAVAADRAARDARTEGHSWAKIAEVLDTDTDPEDPAVAAYERFADVEPDRWREPSFWFRCRVCTAMVHDHGPYERHPADRETGHTPDCPRHTTAITTHERDY